MFYYIGAHRMSKKDTYKLTYSTYISLISILLGQIPLHGKFSVKLEVQAILFYTLECSLYDIYIVLLFEELKSLDKYHPIDPIHFPEW